ncbi:hypothetical protein K8I31_13965, partial [bacterium]|nr:hypothetical protein [bacterium]
MRRLRTRLVFAFLFVALLAMIPVAIIPYYSFNLAKEEERHNDLEAEVTKLKRQQIEFQDNILAIILNKASTYLYNNTFKTRPEIAQMLKTAGYPTDATVQQQVSVYNTIIWNQLPNSVQNSGILKKEDLSILTLAEYKATIEPLDKKRAIEDGNKVYEWTVQYLMQGTHKDNMEMVGAVLVKTLLFKKNSDISSEIIAEKSAVYLNNSP